MCSQAQRTYLSSCTQGSYTDSSLSNCPLLNDFVYSVIPSSVYEISASSKQVLPPLNPADIPLGAASLSLIALYEAMQTPDYLATAWWYRLAGQPENAHLSDSSLSLPYQASPKTLTPAFIPFSGIKAPPGAAVCPASGLGSFDGTTVLNAATTASTTESHCLAQDYMSILMPAQFGNLPKALELAADLLEVPLPSNTPTGHSQPLVLAGPLSVGSTQPSVSVATSLSISDDIGPSIPRSPSIVTSITEVSASQASLQLLAECLNRSKLQEYCIRCAILSH
ncbi:unnamed protein product [Protopolystoma xenopodis]|uniref:Uncharacterized protein n=1 Tax=Protopolystoma xenopodis TaxID=117903 RepID=A0A3S5CN65_9PLAT|nr:unnamed protein product [Protopolystoma xenopodis]